MISFVSRDPLEHPLDGLVAHTKGQGKNKVVTHLRHPGFRLLVCKTITFEISLESLPLIPSQFSFGCITKEKEGRTQANDVDSHREETCLTIQNGGEDSRYHNEGREGRRKDGGPYTG